MRSIDEPNVTTSQSELLKLLIGGWVSSSIGAAVDLGLADLLRRGAMDGEAVAAAMGVAPESLTRLLRMLRALGIVVRDDDRRYSLSPIGELLRSDHPQSMRNLVRLYQEQYFADAWSELVPALRDGEQPFTRAHGETVFDYLGSRPDALAVYGSGIAVGSMFVADLPNVYDFGGKCVVDVGGGDGTLLDVILAAVPDSTGRLIERQAVVSAAVDRLQEYIAQQRCEVFAGNFFDPLPAGGDVAVLCRILHNWDDERARAILENCRAAMRAGSPLLIIERVVSDLRPTPVATAFDMHMFVMTSGRERTDEEYRRLLASAGFELVSIKGLPLEMSLVEAHAR
ncbi:acetylserotonin O-methyltransferase [Nocardia sp. NBC_00881]|uniref:methyltransferase n=1 Tax=Nocardia sp. NBC_00881 TaxID=2975995 RepID=UPI003865B7D8|nr:acetylserotonin O-methyltransferase [Nocardia sp. NBC_00881]